MALRDVTRPNICHSNRDIAVKRRRHFVSGLRVAGRRIIYHSQVWVNAFKPFPGCRVRTGQHQTRYGSYAPVLDRSDSRCFLERFKEPILHSRSFAMARLRVRCKIGNQLYNQSAFKARSLFEGLTTYRDLDRFMVCWVVMNS